MTNIVVIDAHLIYLESLSFILSSDPTIHLLALSQTRQEAIEFLESTSERIDIVILSLQFQKAEFNGIPLAKYILKHFATIKLLVYSMHEVGKHIDEMYQAGISGYLFKNSDKEEFLEAIRQVSAGEIYYSERAKGIVERYLQSQQIAPSKFKGFPS